MDSDNKQDGFVVTGETATPLRSGMHPYWEAHWKNIVLQFLSSSHPNVEVQYGDDDFTAVFRKDDRHGNELCETSRSLENPNTIIPECEVDRLVDDLDKLHKEAEKQSNTDGARQFSREYRVPDPRQMRSAWRISRGPVKKLLLLWGYHPKVAANDVVLPLTPTSKEWEDAKNRVDLKEALREAGRVGKYRFDFGWILFRFLVWALRIALLALVLIGGCWLYKKYKDRSPIDTSERPPYTKPESKVKVIKDGKDIPDLGEDTKKESTNEPTIVIKKPDNQSKPPTTVGGDGPTIPTDTNPVGSGGGGNAGSGQGGGTDGGGGPKPGDDKGKTSTGDAKPDTGSGERMGDDKSNAGSGQGGGTDDGGGPKPGDDKGKASTEDAKPDTDSDERKGDGKSNAGSDDKGKSSTGDAKPEQPQPGTTPSGQPIPPGPGYDPIPVVVIPDFMIRLESKGSHADGSYDPVFKLISQKGLPSNSEVRWHLDEKDVNDETAHATSFQPHFEDGSRHVISAVITNPNAKVPQRTPDFVWYPNEPDGEVPGKDVRRFIEQIGEREDKVGTYFLFDVGSDPQDGKVSVLRWSVKKVAPKESIRDIDPKYENGNTNVLQIHSSDVAGNAQIEITAHVAIEGKGEREIKAKRTFGISSGDTTDQLTSEEALRMEKAGKGVVPSVYLVLTKNGSGTAFAVDKKYLVTNRHVVEGINKLSLYAARSKEEIKGVVDRIDSESDLALIKIKGKMDMTALALAESESVYSRQIVSCVGFPVPAFNAEKLPSGGVEPSIASGILHGYNPWAETAYSDLKAFHGNSGSPVVNELGKVVGVVFAGTWDKTRDGEINEKTHRSCIVTLTMLKRFLKKSGIAR